MHRYEKIAGMALLLTAVPIGYEGAKALYDVLKMKYKH